MALLPWQKGIVIRIEAETADTRRFWIRFPEVATFDFLPGQFITLDLPIHEKPNKRWRSYSIASWPDGSNVVELLIVLDEQGAGTSYLFNTLTVGTELTVRGPQGVFTLHSPLEEDLLLICTETGIAPFRSMLQHIHLRQLGHRNIYLVFGCRTRKELLYYEEMKKLEAAMPGFHYLPTLSREQWEGPTGYVHPLYETVCSGRQPARFYLCGWKKMIDEARTRIVQLGYDKKMIHYELYG